MFEPKGKSCPKCGKKGLHFCNHPHALGYKNYDKVECRFCKTRFTVGAKNTEQLLQPDSGK